MNLKQEVDVDRTQTLRVYRSARLPLAKIGCFVRANVQERSGENGRNLLEPLIDEIERTWLARRKDISHRRLGERRVLLIFKDVM